MGKMLSIKNNRGTQFNVRIVEKGEKYGLNFALTHNEEDPLVEVYDAEYSFTEFGQFVSRYYMSTLLNGRSKFNGIDLMGYEPKWKIDAANWRKVIQWLYVYEEQHTELVDFTDALTGGAR